MSITRVKNKGVIRFRYEFKAVVGKQQYRFTKLLSRAYNEKTAAEFDVEETARQYEKINNPAGPGDKPTIAACVKLYIEHHCPTVKTGKMIEDELALHVDDIGDTLLENIGPFSREFMKKYSEGGHFYKEGKPLSPATIAHRLAYIRSAVNFACKLFPEQVGENMGYAKRMSLPVFNNQHDHFIDFDADLPKILEKCRDDEIRAFIMFACYTGMRRGEIIRLTGKGKDNTLFIADSKNGLKHKLPLHPILEPYAKFLPFDTMHVRQYFKHFKMAAKRAGFPWLTIHMLRHSLAARLAEKGKNLMEIGIILNHKSPSSTWRYKHLLMDGKRKILEAA